MATYTFSTGVHFVWKEVLYRIVELLPENKVRIEGLESGTTQDLPEQRLWDAWRTGELVIASGVIGGISNKAGKQKPGAVHLQLDDFSEAQKAKALFRRQVIEPLISMTRHECTNAAVEARIAEIKAEISSDPIKQNYLRGLTLRNVRRWIRRYVVSGEDIRSLIDNDAHRGGRHKSRLDPVVASITDSVIDQIYRKRESATINAVGDEVARRIGQENHRRLLSEQLRLPSDGAILRRVGALDVRDFFIIKHGSRAAHHKFDQVGQTTYPTKPLERVEIDDTRLDLIVIDEKDGLPLGRPTFCWCIDLATRYPLGYYVGFEPPSYYTVMECLYHSICPKEDVMNKYGTEHPWITEGIPKTLVVDNARQYIGKDLEDTCESLGITLQYSPVRRPETKAAVERSFLTLNKGLIHTVAGTTFSNIVERGNYDSVGNAIVPLPTLDKLLHLYIVDYYAESFHKGLNGIPARRWESAMKSGFSPRFPASRDELLVLLGRVEHRLIERTGIELFNLRYNSPDLSRLRILMKGQPVKVKYHPGDLSKVHVADPYEKVYIEIPALDQEYTANLSLWKHNLILEMLHQEKAKVDRTSLGRAKEKMRDEVDAARSRKHSTRALVARWDQSGQSKSKSSNPQQTGGKPSTPFFPPDQIAKPAPKKRKPGRHDWEVAPVPAA